MTDPVKRVAKNDCCQPKLSDVVSDHDVATKVGRRSTLAAVGSAILSPPVVGYHFYCWC